MSRACMSIEQARQTFDVFKSLESCECPVCACLKHNHHAICIKCWRSLPWPIGSDMANELHIWRYNRVWASVRTEDPAAYVEAFWVVIEYFDRCGVRRSVRGLAGVACLLLPKPEVRCCDVVMKTPEEAGFAVCGTCADIWAIDEDGNGQRATAGQRLAALRMADVQRAVIAARAKEEAFA